jgi:hypothetical protein
MNTPLFNYERSADHLDMFFLYLYKLLRENFFFWAMIVSQCGYCVVIFVVLKLTSLVGLFFLCLDLRNENYCIR